MTRVNLPKMCSLPADMKYRVPVNQMLETPELPHALASSLTLCLSHCCFQIAKSASTDQPNDPKILHLTSVRHPQLLDPASWTGEAGRTRTCRSGIDVIMAGNQKDDDIVCCTADRCKV